MVAIVTGSGLGVERSSGSILGDKGQVGSALTGRAGESVNVNAANGNLVIKDRDEVLIGRGPDAIVDRAYNSLGQGADDNGDNWRLGMQRRLVNWSGTPNVPGATVSRIGGDGSTIAYTYDSTQGVYLTAEGVGAYDKLQNFGDHWLWTDGDTGVVDKYDIGGNLLSQFDRDGNSTSYQYDWYNGHYRLIRVDIAEGGKVEFAWAGENLTGLTTTYVDVAGVTKTLTRTRYTYDGSNRLTAVTVDLSPEDGSIADGRTYTTTYSYVGSSKLVSSIVQTDGSRIDFTYDGSNRVASFTEWVDGGTNRTTTFTYGAGYTCINDPAGNQTQLYFVADGRLFRRNDPPAQPGGNWRYTQWSYATGSKVDTQFVYDGYANFAGGVAVSRDYYRYDSRGNLYDRYQLLEGGYRVTRYYYNSSSKLLTESSYTGLDADGHGGADPAGAQTTRYTYDAEQHLRFTMSPEGRVTEYRYDAPGNLVSTITYVSSLADTTGLAESASYTEQELSNWVAAVDKSQSTRTDTGYDFRGNVSMVTTYAKVDSAGAGILAAGFTRDIYVYDQFGNLLSKQSANGEPLFSLTDLEASWSYSGLVRTSDGTAQNGSAAFKFAAQSSGAWAGIWASQNAAAGDTFTAAITLKGVGGTSSAGIGIYGSSTQWGDARTSMARIVSGPGTIVRDAEGFWNVSGLSASAETRVEVTRTFAQADSTSFYLYPDRPQGWRAGQGVVASSPVVVKSRDVTETYAYDGLGRTIRHTDAKGVGTWTTYAEAQNRTIVTQANGLVQTNAYNRAGELVAFSESRGGYAGDNTYANQAADWTYSGSLARTAAGTVDGAPAFKYTVSQPGVWSSASVGFSVNAGDVITMTASLQAVGDSLVQYLGLIGGGSGWGASNYSTARIVSGPGQLSQTVGGLWTISGLSTTEPTRIEVVRAYDQAENVSAYVLVDYPQGSRAGAALIVSAPSVVTSRYGEATPGNVFDPAQSDINAWSQIWLTSAAAGTIGNLSAVKYTVSGPTSGQSQQAVAPNYFNVSGGDTVTASIFLKATNTSANAAFGIYGHTSSWGYTTPSAGFARIVSGPGQISQYWGASGFWYISGLSETAETRIEISRTFEQAEDGSVRLYPDYVNGSILGNAIIAGAPAVSRTPGDLTSYKYDALGNPRIKVDTAGQRTFLFYDNQSRKIGEVAANGAVTEYRYDARDLVVATVSYAAAYPAGSIAGLYDFYGNPTAVTFAQIKSAIGTSSNDRWSWSVYDLAGRLVEAVDATGAATVFEFDGADRVVRTTRYANLIAAGAVAGFKTTPPPSVVLPSADAANDRVVRAFYDKDGNLAGTLDGEGNLVEYVYDKAGRAIETIAYYSRPSSSYWVSGTFAQLKSTQATHAKDIHSYTVYDGRGLVAALIDGEGDVTRFEYDARGNVARESRGQKVTAATAYTYATLPAATVSVAIKSYVRDALGQVTGSTEQNPGGSVTVSASYNAMGDLVSATDGRGTVTTSYYDARGRLVRVDTPIGNGSTATARYEYDSRGNLVKSTDARGNSSYNYYDERSRLVLAIDTEGYATRTTYNVFGEVAAVTRYYNRAGAVSSLTVPPSVITDARDITTTFGYNSLGQANATTDANGVTEYFQYNAFGQVFAHQNKLTGTTYSYYDRRGLLWYADAAGENAYLSNGALESSTIRTLYEYDAFGNVYRRSEAHTLSSQRDTYFVYDRANRLYQKQLPSILVLNDATGAETLTARSELNYHDARGNLIETIDAAGAATFLYYDLLDRKVAEIRQLSTSQAVYTAYGYDPDGNLISTKAYEGNASLPGSPGGTTPAAPSGAWRETQFAYDNLGRMTASTVVSNVGNAILSGSWNGSSYVTTTASLTSTFQYDATGNLLRVADPNGNLTWNWYDKLGRKIAQVDSESYLTTWGFDAEGNVLVETQYATRFTGTLTAGAPPSVGISSDDRVTTFTYDKYGNRLTEARSGVVAWTVDASTGALSPSATNSQITYTYNALGQVLTKTVAGSGVAAWYYDAFGRLTSEAKQAFTDVNGSVVTPTTTYQYDGLGGLVRANQVGASGAFAAADRVTTYAYGAGGQLRTTTDAEGNIHTYSYDIAARRTRDAYNRVVSADATLGNAATTTVAEAQTTTYDLGGRMLTQAIVSAGVRIGYTSYQYNNFDQVTQQGTGSNSASGMNAGSALYQTVNQYDAGGRLTGTNAGDGVWKFYSYDAVGNQTAAVTSAGASFSAGTGFAAALAQAGVATVNATYTFYDKRNMATQVVEEGRDLSAVVTGQALVTNRAYTAFGEVASETDARGSTLTYRYNTMGRLLRRESPAVQITRADGSSVWAKPANDYYYDLGGRLVAMRDANGTYAGGANTQATAYAKAADTGNLTTLSLLAGTGYDGAEALVSTEFHTDGGRKQTLYDVLGDARLLRDELYAAGTPNLHVTEQSFNRLGQLTQVKHNRSTDTGSDATRLIDEYRYDQFGQRLQHWNSQLGSGTIEKTAYEALGRVASQTDLGGYVTTTSYAWDGTLAASGLAAFGGWIETTTYANSKTRVVRSDSFGHRAESTDLGGHTTRTFYDTAGRAIETRDVTYGATGGAAWSFVWLNSGRQGQVTSSDGGVTTYGYDASGHLTAERLVQSGVTLKDQTATYDALGRTTDWIDMRFGASGSAAESHMAYDAVGNVRTRANSYRESAGGYQYSYLDGYVFDTMHRMVNERGTLYAYDAAGNRVSASVGASKLLRSHYIAGEGYQREVVAFFTNVTNYIYDGAGRVIRIDQVDRDAAFVNNNISDPSYYVFDKPTVVTQSYGYDLMSRIVSQADTVSGTTSTYNALGQLTQSVRTQGSATTTTTYGYGSGTGYALGQALSATAVQGSSTQTSTYTYQWFDGAVRATTVTSGSGAQANGTSSASFDASGRTTQVVTTGALNATVTTTYDAADQAIVSSSSLGAPYSDRWYRMGGTLMWHPSMRNPVATAGGDPNAGGGTYTTKAGDTLSAIAGQVWGDRSLWYKLAEANGLASDAVPEGVALRIPTGIWRSHLTADTFLPYDPAAFSGAGEASPLYPTAKPRGNKCGVFGQILLAAVAVAVTAIAPIGGGFAANIANAALGSAVSQGVGLATGIQDKFSFKGVALSAVGGAVGGGLKAADAFGKLGIAGTSAGALAAQGALTSAVTQGVGVATGLQSKFDWAGVAASAVGNAAGAKFADAIGAKSGSFGGDFAATTASTLANAATRSALSGTSFGGNLIAALPDAIGGVVGRALGGAALSAIERANERRDALRLGYNNGLVDGRLAGLVGGSPTSFSYAGGAIADPLATPMSRTGSGAGTAYAGAAGGAGEIDGEPIIVIGDRYLRTLLQLMTDNTFRSYQSKEPEGLASRTIFAGDLLMKQTGRTGGYDFRSAYEGEITRSLKVRGSWRPGVDIYDPPIGDGGFVFNALFDGILTGGVGFVSRLGSGLLARGGGEVVAGLAARNGAADSADFVGPLIGKSGFRTSGEFAEAVGTRYQGFVDDAYVAAQRLEAKGLLRGNASTRVGDYVDRVSANRLQAYFRSEGISEGPGSLVQMNRWLRDPNGSGLYVRPDVRIPAAGRIYDATVGVKAYDSTQIVRFGQYSGGDRITIVRPNPLGSYSIVP